MLIKRTKIIGVSAVLFFVVTAGVLGALVYVIVTTEKELGEQKLELARAQLHEQELSALVRLVESTEFERQELASYILNENEVVPFVGLVEQLGRERGLELKTTSLDVASVDSQFEELVVSVVVEGTYGGVLDIISLFETLPYQSSISNVIVSRGNDNIWNGAFKLHVTKYKQP